MCVCRELVRALYNVTRIIYKKVCRPNVSLFKLCREDFLKPIVLHLQKHCIIVQYFPPAHL